ncbi:hypothetical protein JTB14_036859 [Gonioctena quinquepunctata]|nr:hypothetical protein JTB14_036859 [Gonioctena quinquepunctata]
MNAVPSKPSFNYILGEAGETIFLNLRGFGYLPETVLFRIFSYFNEEELRKNILPVCQRWRTVAEHPSLWKILKFRGDSMKTSFICDKVWQFNEVNTIIIRDILEPVVILRQICRCSLNLRHLTIRNCPQITEDSLRHLVFSCKNLETLDLKGTPFRALIFYEELASVKSLATINFSDNFHLTTSNITTTILNCRSLTGFHLSTFKPSNKMDMTDADCRFMLSHMVLRLTSLSLDCSTLSSYSISSILRCKHLEYICLNYAYNFDPKDFQDLWKTIKKLRSLKIRFAHQIGDLSVKNLFENGKKVMSDLEVIDLTGCSKIGNVGVIAIAKHCSKLRTLVLRSCRNLTSLDLLLTKCQMLETLNIAFCENLHLDNQPVPENLKNLFISEGKNFKLFANLMMKSGSDVIVRICESEYNKNIVK